MTNLVHRYGRLPVRYDARTLHLADYLKPELPEPPQKADWLSKVPGFPMMLNDQLGDCTCAAVGHMIQAWTQYASGDDKVVTDAQVLKAYEAVSGYNPATGEGDNGANEVDVLNYWRRTGVGGHKIGAWVKVDHKDHREVKQAIAIFGGIYTGFLVSQSAEDQFGAGQPWTRQRTKAGRTILGGHAVPIGAYDADGAEAVTWAAVQKLTWEFFDDYFEEAYAIVSADWLDPATDTSPSGLDTKALAADLKAIGA